MARAAITTPLLGALAEPIEPSLAPVAEQIDRAVEPDGSGLRDSASPELRRLRKQLRDHQQRAAEELRRLARSSALRDHLQEDFVAQRGGRPVFAVRASARGSVPGIVHDVSDSGQTVFIEPLELVEMSNKHAEVASAEREEVLRILRELSAAVGARADARRRARRGDGRDRPRGRARGRLARLARRRGDDRRRGAAARGAAPAARPEDGGADRPRARRRCARS